MHSQLTGTCSRLCGCPLGLPSRSLVAERNGLHSQSESTRNQFSTAHRMYIYEKRVQLYWRGRPRQLQGRAALPSAWASINSPVKGACMHCVHVCAGGRPRARTCSTWSWWPTCCTSLCTAPSSSSSSCTTACPFTWCVLPAAAVLYLAADVPPLHCFGTALPPPHRCLAVPTASPAARW